MKRRKVADERKESSIRIRVTEEQKELFAAAAARAGLDVSGWLRFIAIKEANKTSDAK